MKEDRAAPRTNKPAPRKAPAHAANPNQADQADTRRGHPVRIVNPARPDLPFNGSINTNTSTGYANNQPGDSGPIPTVWGVFANHFLDPAGGTIQHVADSALGVVENVTDPVWGRATSIWGGAEQALAYGATIMDREHRGLGDPTPHAQPGNPTQADNNTPDPGSLWNQGEQEGPAVAVHSLLSGIIGDGAPQDQVLTPEAEAERVRVQHANQADQPGYDPHFQSNNPAVLHAVTTDIAGNPLPAKTPVAPALTPQQVSDENAKRRAIGPNPVDARQFDAADPEQRRQAYEVYNGGSNGREAQNIEMGAILASSFIPIDPLIAASYAVKVARITTVSRGLDSTERVGNVANRAAALSSELKTAAEQLSVEYAGGKVADRTGATVALRFAQSTDSPSKLLHYPFFREMVNPIGAAVAAPLKDHNVIALVLRASTGDREAYTALAQNEYLTAEAFGKEARKYDAINELVGAPNAITPAGTPLATADLTQMLIPDALHDQALVYRNLMDKHAEAKALVNMYNQSVGAQTTFSKLASIEKLRVAHAEVAAKLETGAWRVDKIDRGPFTRPLAVLHWLGKENPAGLIHTKGWSAHDSHLELDAVMNTVPELRTPAGVKLRQTLKDNYLSAHAAAAPDLARANAYHDAEERIIHHIMETNGVQLEVAKKFYQDYKHLRNHEVQQFKENKYWVDAPRDAEGVTIDPHRDANIVTSPFLEAMLATAIPTAPLGLISTLVRQHKDELIALGNSPSALARTQGAHPFLAAREAWAMFDRVWRPAVLLRGGYTIRNVGEGLGRSVMFLGKWSDIHPWSESGRSVTNFVNNTYNRNKYGRNGGRLNAEQVKEMKAAKVSRPFGQRYNYRDWLDYKIRRGNALVVEADNMQPEIDRLLSEYNTGWAATDHEMIRFDQSLTPFRHDIPGLDIPREGMAWGPELDMTTPHTVSTRIRVQREKQAAQDAAAQATVDAQLPLHKAPELPKLSRKPGYNEQYPRVLDPAADQAGIDQQIEDMIPYMRVEVQHDEYDAQGMSYLESVLKTSKDYDLFYDEGLLPANTVREALTPGSKEHFGSAGTTKEDFIAYLEHGMSSNKAHEAGLSTSDSWAEIGRQAESHTISRGRGKRYIQVGPWFRGARQRAEDRMSEAEADYYRYADENGVTHPAETGPPPVGPAHITEADYDRWTAHLAPGLQEALTGAGRWKPEQFMRGQFAPDDVGYIHNWMRDNGYGKLRVGLKPGRGKHAADTGDSHLIPRPDMIPSPTLDERTIRDAHKTWVETNVGVDVPANHQALIDAEAKQAQYRRDAAAIAADLLNRQKQLETKLKLKHRGEGTFTPDKASEHVPFARFMTSEHNSNGSPTFPDAYAGAHGDVLRAASSADTTAKNIASGAVGMHNYGEAASLAASDRIPRVVTDPGYHQHYSDGRCRHAGRTRGLRL